MAAFLSDMAVPQPIGSRPVYRWRPVCASIIWRKRGSTLKFAVATLFLGGTFIECGNSLCCGCHSEWKPYLNCMFTYTQISAMSTRDNLNRFVLIVITKRAIPLKYCCGDCGFGCCCISCVPVVSDSILARDMRCFQCNNILSKIRPIVT